MGLFDRVKGAVRAEIDESIAHGRTLRESKEAHRAQARAEAALAARCAALGIPGRLGPLVEPFAPGYAVVDLETTGIDPSSDRIVSIALLLLDPDGRRTNVLSTLVDPQRPIPRTVSAIHGITAAKVKGAPAFDRIADDVRAMIDGRALIAFNADFDNVLLRHEMERASRWFTPGAEGCAMQAFQAAYPLAEGFGLDQAAAVLGLDGTAIPHDALADGEVAAQITRTMIEDGVDPTLTRLDRDMFFWLRSRVVPRKASSAQIRRLYAIARTNARLVGRDGRVDDRRLLDEARRVARVDRLEDLTARDIQDLYDRIEPTGRHRAQQGTALYEALLRRPGKGAAPDGERAWPVV